MLKEYGWKHSHERYWTRPGKERGISATVFDDSVVWVFTSATCLEPGNLYDSFGLLARYEFGGDFNAAAKTISKAIDEAA